MSPRRILYVAPETGSMMADIEALSDYELTRIGGIDQTPATGHLLITALLTRRNR
jgi:tRNA/tmRNA/rRNA uracil-C5-methylase (TrmA/RlmC/RlmD family)